jgi:antitoxin PrlF
MPIGTLTSKGQITIPKQIRERLRLETGRRVEFNVDSKGNVILTPHSKDIRALKGIVRSRPKGRAVSVKEMNDAVADGFSKR